MRLSSIAALVVIVASTSGCGALDRVNDALYETGAFDLEPSSSRAAPECGVMVIAGDRRGRGVIVGKTTVLTVAHVVGAESTVEVATSSVRWSRARVVRRIPSTPEDVIELEVETSKSAFGFESFDAGRLATPGAGAPSFVVTATGARGWAHAQALRPGDSGSPVLDREGALVGVLVGKTRDGSGVFAPVGVPSRVAPAAPATDSPVVIARLAGSK